MNYTGIIGVQRMNVNLIVFFHKIMLDLVTHTGDIANNGDKFTPFIKGIEAMNNATRQELVDLVNDMSNEDIRKLLEIVSNRVDFYVGLVGNRCVMGEIESVLMNGTSVQVNLELDYDLGQKESKQ